MSFDSYSAFKKSDPFANPRFIRPNLERDYSPAELDRLADAELAHGHVARAEQLAWRAAALREARA
ncbi:hypothetical protein [Acidisoma silvae]|uniref:Uncharacterized protein n=1 Tax=Acidisoma silvae TaxID=2802396 RepID=A0A963YWE9_9PROT|nr:hypothetical protein [Acidisoma silvae]MCB8877602.1 hypothetical protein [Acidisoma silvae]